jgi:hypothetical protein
MSGHGRRLTHLRKRADAQSGDRTRRKFDKLLQELREQAAEEPRRSGPRDQPTKEARG